MGALNVLGPPTSAGPSLITVQCGNCTQRKYMHTGAYIIIRLVE